MEHLKSIGTVIYLNVPFEALSRRLSNLTARGVVLNPGQTLIDLYNERTILYQQYADITINEENLGTEETLKLILESFGG